MFGVYTLACALLLLAWPFLVLLLCDEPIAVGVELVAFGCGGATDSSSTTASAFADVDDDEFLF
jgi:hypothetical protein